MNRDFSRDLFPSHNSRIDVHGVNFDDVRYDIGSGLGLARATIEIGLRRSDIGQEVAAITRQALAGHLSRLSQSPRPPVVKP